jgi:hypothetical protein
MSLTPTDTDFSFDQLFAGDYPVVSEEVTILSGQTLSRGAVIGRQTSGLKGVLVDSDGTDDGRRAPYGVLAEDVDASGGDVVSTVYLTGEYNVNALSFGAGDTAATHKTALRALNIYVRSGVAS